MNEQICLFDIVDHDLRPGDWVDAHGRELTFEEASSRTGELLVNDCSTESRQWLKIIRVEQCISYMDGDRAVRRLICFDGHKQRLLLSDYYFKDQGYTGRFPTRLFEVAV